MRSDAQYQSSRKETPDPTPVEVPFGFSYESLADTIGCMVAVENAKIHAKKEYVESFAESQDFGEDPDEIRSQHEMTEMQEEEPATTYEASAALDYEKPPEKPPEEPPNTEEVKKPEAAP